MLIHLATPMFQLLMATRTLTGISTQKISLLLMPFLSKLEIAQTTDQILFSMQHDPNDSHHLPVSST